MTEADIMKGYKFIKKIFCLMVNPYVILHVISDCCSKKKCFSKIRVQIQCTANTNRKNIEGVPVLVTGLSEMRGCSRSSCHQLFPFKTMHYILYTYLKSHLQIKPLGCS